MTNKKTTLAIAIALTLGTGAVHAAQVSADAFGIYLGTAETTSIRGNFTMLRPDGSMQGGTNDVFYGWDGTVFTDSSDYTGPGSTANMTATSNEPFSSRLWTAHDIQLFAPGTYSFDVTLGGGAFESSTLTATAGSGQMLMHMLFDWGSNLNIDMVLVLEQGGVFGSGNGYFETYFQNSEGPPVFPCGAAGSNCLWDGDDDGIYHTAGTPLDGILPDSNGDGLPDGGVVWDWVSVDGDGDGIPGVAMPNGGPYAGFQANFNVVTIVPVPAAVWLFGSGLLGLVGVARQKQRKG